MKKLIPIDNSTDEVLHAGNREKNISVQGMLWKNFDKKIVELNIKKTSFYHYVPGYKHRGIRIFEDHLFVRHYKASLEQPNQIERREEPFFGVAPNIKDELWVGVPNGIGQIDIKTNAITHRIPSKFKKARFWSILRSQEGKWWASSIGRGLFTSNFPQNDSLYQFDQIQ